MFEGFTRADVATSGARIRVRYGGSGPPLLLLHGNPLTHLSWHHIAPRLAERFTVVAPDLRGYGDSSKPPGGSDHAAYSFRALARDQIELMRELGFARFFAAGHDRGARVVHRLALDHPAAVRKAAVLDIVPAHYLFTHPTHEWAVAAYHWFLMMQPFDLPERLIGAAPEYYLRRHLGRGAAGTSFFAPEALAEYLRCFTPETIHAICEDYRATAGVDFALDAADVAAGKKVGCELLVLWGARGTVGKLFDPPAIWRAYADLVSATALPCGHYLAEEAPQATCAELGTFFARA